MAVKQTAGRDALGEFAPKFAELNDDVLFGEVWSREEQLSLRDRSLVTVIALMAQGLTDESFRYHLMTAKKNGITTDTFLLRRTASGRSRASPPTTCLRCSAAVSPESRCSSAVSAL